MCSGILVVSGCMRAESSSDAVAEAARADSSAAGYAVGANTPPSRVSSTTATTAPVPSGTRDTGAIVAAHASAVPRGSQPGPRASATRVDTSGPRRDSGVVQEPVTPLPIGLARVNEFLSYDAQARTATLALVAGYNGLNDALNYNGGARGSQGVSVPLGWTVRVAVTNRDSDLQHSATVIRQVLPPPEDMPAPAFAGALLPRLEEGMHEGDTASFGFVADRTGRFMIACGVPGHAQGGMWLRLTVSSEIDRPSYR